MTAINKKPSAIIRRLKKWKEAIADYAAFRLLMTLHRNHFADVQKPEAFVVLPAQKTEAPSSRRCGQTQTDSRKRIVFLTPRHSESQAASQSARDK